MQIERARELVPGATFLCGDMTAATFEKESFDAILCLYALIHVPLAEQLPVLRKVAAWLRPGGLFLATVGHNAWTGLERNWLGMPGADMWWSHADAATYREWMTTVGLRIEREEFVPDGPGGHIFILATR